MSIQDQIDAIDAILEDSDKLLHKSISVDGVNASFRDLDELREHKEYLEKQLNEGGKLIKCNLKRR